MKARRIHTDQKGVRFRGENWIPHPEADIDLCILPIADAINQLQQQNFDAFVVYNEIENIPNPQQLENLDPLEPILMVGYPIGLWDSVNNLPLLRRGVTSTHPKLDYKGKAEFLIDAAVFPGSSGSPVYLYDFGMYREGQQSKLGTRFYLLGINYKYIFQTGHGDIKVEDIPTAQREYAEVRTPANLGIVIRANKLSEFEPILRRNAEEAKVA
jgi:hypothetical protein